MTLIQLNNQNAPFRAMMPGMIFLSLAAVISVIMIIIMQTDIAGMKRATDAIIEESSAIQTGNADLEQQLLRLFDLDYMHKEVSGRGLIVEKNPRYVKINDLWVFASRY